MENGRKETIIENYGRAISVLRNWQKALNFFTGLFFVFNCISLFGAKAVNIEVNETETLIQLFGTVMTFIIYTIVFNLFRNMLDKKRAQLQALPVDQINYSVFDSPMINFLLKFYHNAVAEFKFGRILLIALIIIIVFLAIIFFMSNM